MWLLNVIVWESKILSMNGKFGNPSTKNEERGEWTGWDGNAAGVESGCGPKWRIVGIEINTSLQFQCFLGRGHDSIWDEKYLSKKSIWDEKCYTCQIFFPKVDSQVMCYHFENMLLSYEWVTYHLGTNFWEENLVSVTFLFWDSSCQYLVVLFLCLR